MRILILTCTYGPYEESLDRIADLELKTNFQAIWLISFHNPHPINKTIVIREGRSSISTGWINLVENMNMARNFALKSGFDYLFLVEHDICPPQDAFVKLSQSELPVVCGIYKLKTSSEWCVKVLNKFKYQKTKNYVHSWTPFPDWMVNMKGICQVASVPFGCTLVRTDVLKHIQFRIGEKDDYSIDMAFSKDCFEAGYPLYCNTSVVCKHLQ